ncbi:HNH endonuclease [Terracoccus luteus]|uniref:HNH endonuclease n=1 Tax=Terracoccus luteus TaxID=53356 RepID=UPI001B8723DF|nr:HNH endonuclease signature motif containing protein [Terracoccus luteus]
MASQEQESIGWRAQSQAALDANDFGGWLHAREKADLASWAAALEFGAHTDTRGSRANDEAAGDSSGGSAGSDGPGGTDGSSEPERPVSSSRRNLIAKGGVAAQVALARHLSPFKGAEGIRFSLSLTHDMPHTLALLEAGVLSEWRALNITKEAAILSPEHRRLLDQELHDTYGERLGGLGDRELNRLVRAVAYRLDPESVLRRARKAESERRVTVKAAPDTMAYLTALLPAAEAVAAYAALTGAAAGAKAAGDERGKGQVMADTLVDRVLGRVASEPSDIDETSAHSATATATDAAATDAQTDTPDEFDGEPATDKPSAPHDASNATGAVGQPRPARGTDAPPPESADRAGVDVEVQLVIGLDALFNTGDGADTPAQLLGYGTVPAGWARDYLRPSDLDDDPLSADAGGGQASDRGGGLSRAGKVWIRRLFVRPDTGELVAMDSRRRLFTDGLRRFVLTRDAATCRTPWCDAPARHIDHVTPHADGGPTTAANGQGLCVACNLTKEHPALTSTTLPPDSRGTGRSGHTVRVTTGTGHSYDSEAPPLLPGAPPGDRSRAGVPPPTPPMSDAPPPRSRTLSETDCDDLRSFLRPIHLSAIEGLQEFASTLDELFPRRSAGQRAADSGDVALDVDVVAQLDELERMVTQGDVLR